MKSLLLGFLSFALLAAHFLTVPAVAQVSFEKNEGQWPSSIRYTSVGSGYRAALLSDGLRLSPIYAAKTPGEVTLRWIDGNANPEISVQDPLPYHSNYFVGNSPQEWKSSVPFFGEVVYHNIYPGISVSYHGKGNEIEQDIHIEPGADAARFRFQVQGAKKVLVGRSGELVLESGDGSFRLALPRIYQVDGRGQQSRVTGHYVLQGSIVSFQLGQYNHREKLVIDPVLSYSTYLPKINFDLSLGPNVSRGLNGSAGVISVNSSGTACVTDGYALYGYDATGHLTFTVSDIFFTKPQIFGNTVFTDEQGNCFLGGTEHLVPPTGENVAGIAKFSSTGALDFASYFSGHTPPDGGGASINQIVTDSLGNIYLAGGTNFSDFPLKNPIQNLLVGTGDGIIMKLDPTGSNLIYSTYFGTNNDGRAIAVDAAQNAYFAGDQGTIPVTNGVFQGAPKSTTNAWVAKIGPQGALLYGTYLGGTNTNQGEHANAIAVDANGNAYVAGQTFSSDFPTTVGAFETTLPGASSGFVSKFSPDATSLVYSTFMGGSDSNVIHSLALDSSGTAYLSGDVAGPNFPLLHPIQSDFLNSTLPLNGGTFSQMFVTVLNSTGSALQFSTFLGGPDHDFNSGVGNNILRAGIGVDSAHNIYVGGSIQPSAADFVFHGFPLVAADNGLYTPFFPICYHFSCGTQGFIAKISLNDATALASPSGVDFQTVIKGQSSSSVQVFIANVGANDIQISSTAITGDYTISNNTCAGTLLSAKHCEVDVTFGPTAGGTRTGVLTLTSNAPDSPRNIQLTGIGGVPIVSLNPTSLSLTSPSIGTSGPTRTVVLSNTGADTLNITGLGINGTTDFSETHDCSSTLPAGQSCNANVTYKASTSNTETAMLQFMDNASGSPHTVPLTGTISAFGLTIAPGGSASATIAAGQMATYNLMIGGPGFSGNVTLSCTGAPAAASCSVPGSESLSSTPATFQATVMTTARSTAIKLPSSRDLPPAPVVAVVVLGLSGLVLMASKRRRMVIALACVSFAVVLMASCGGGGSGGGGGSNGTPAGTSTIVVTATSGSTSQSMNLTLNVN